MLQKHRLIFPVSFSHFALDEMSICPLQIELPAVEELFIAISYIQIENRGTDEKLFPSQLSNSSYSSSTVISYLSCIFQLFNS